MKKSLTKIMKSKDINYYLKWFDIENINLWRVLAALLLISFTISSVFNLTTNNNENAEINVDLVKLKGNMQLLLDKMSPYTFNNEKLDVNSVEIVDGIVKYIVNKDGQFIMNVYSTDNFSYIFDQAIKPDEILKQIEDAKEQAKIEDDISSKVLDVNVSGMPFLGNENAEITLIEYSDYDCTFCKRFHVETFDQIKSKYIDTGLVKFVYVDYPISQLHPNAMKASEAAKCASEQDKYWEMHNKLFENQGNLSLINLKKYGKELGLDEVKFNECLDSGKYEEEIINNIYELNLLRGKGVGTPFFLLNGVQISGAQPFAVFENLIESQLN